MIEWKKLRQMLERYQIPLLIFLIGMILMLIPGRSEKESAAQDSASALAELLSDTQGVGEARVLISDSGVVIACTGPANAAVRLDMIRAVTSYTGFGSDKITILKLKNEAGRRHT